MTSVSIENLKKVYALSDLPDQHLQWILDHSDYKEYEDRDIIVRNGEPIDSLWIILEGAAEFYQVINGQEVYFITFENNKESGGVTGLLPYSRMKTSVGNSYAIGKVRRLALHKKYFAELEKLNMPFIQRLIAYMTDRARTFATVQLQHEKVNALGKLSAGIAHELNNPASAISRLASELSNCQSLNFSLTKKLLVHCVDPFHLDSINDMLKSKVLSKSETRMSVKKRIEIEDEFQEWLTNRGVEENDDLYETFTTAGVTIAELESIHGMVTEKSFNDVVVWYGNLLRTQKIISDLELASGRISTLVGAIKSHVHMDRTNDAQPTNVVNDIENTLMLLGHKLREKNIEIIRNFKEPIPNVEAYVGELNQVWMNVLDNAIYAMGKNGNLTLEVFTKNNDLKINIIDDGVGIPADIIARIFDPFFTTKKVGDGTGVGLDIVNRIIKRHQGEIKVNSSPGHTEFNICLPLQQPKKPS